jgi:hypothetical protein
MTISHTVDMTVIPGLSALVEFTMRRLELSPEEAAQSQPEFERAYVGV